MATHILSGEHNLIEKIIKKNNPDGQTWYTYFEIHSIWICYLDTQFGYSIWIFYLNSEQLSAEKALARPEELQKKVQKQ